MHVNEMLTAYYQKAIAERKAMKKNKPMKKQSIKKEKKINVPATPAVEDHKIEDTGLTEIVEPIFGVEDPEWVDSLKKTNPIAYENLKNWN